MRSIENVEQEARQVAAIIKTLHAIPGPEEQRCETRVGAIADDWSNRLLISAAISFGLLALLAGIHLITPLPYTALTCAQILSAVVQILALLSIVLKVSSEVASALIHLRRTDLSLEQKILNDYEMADRLSLYSTRALDAADSWLDQEIKRLERRQLRFFGSPDKLALAALITAGWST